MALSKTASQPVRKLNKMGDMTYSVTLPKDYIKNLGWQQYQKLRVTQQGDKIIIEDWEEEPPFFYKGRAGDGFYFFFDFSKKTIINFRINFLHGNPKYCHHCSC